MSEKSKHTPGPWKWVTGPTIDPLLVPADYQFGGDYVLSPADWGFEDSLHANAILVACSPELLEALRGLLSGNITIRDGLGTVTIDTTVADYDAARAVLVKAEGF